MHGTFARDVNEILDAETSQRLSTRLRMARHMRGMTLKVLADAAGCSESLLSKLENGKAYPSLPMLNRLVQSLGIGMGWMFDDQEGREPVISRLGQRPEAAVPAEAGCIITVERVIPDSGEHALQCNIFHLEVGASSSGEHRQAGEEAGTCSPSEHRHAGEETGYLLDGHLELLIDGRAHRLSAGDAFAFHSDLPHSFRNVGQTRARVFWVNKPAVI